MVSLCCVVNYGANNAKIKVTYAKAYDTALYFSQLTSSRARYCLCQPVYQVIATASDDEQTGTAHTSAAGMNASTARGMNRLISNARSRLTCEAQ